MTPWWSEHAAAYIGAFGLGGLGALGGILGAMGGWLAPRGVGKGPILGCFAAIAAGGLIALGVGLYGLIDGQPYHVWYPLVLGGGIMGVVMGSLYPVMAMRYRQADARRLNAEEFRRGA